MANGYGNILKEAIVGGSLAIVALGLSTFLNSVGGIFQGDTTGIAFTLAVLAGATTVVVAGIKAFRIGNILQGLGSLQAPVTAMIWLFVWLLLVGAYSAGLGVFTGQGIGQILGEFVALATSLQALFYLVGVMLAYTVAGWVYKNNPAGS